MSYFDETSTQLHGQGREFAYGAKLGMAESFRTSYEAQQRTASLRALSWAFSLEDEAQTRQFLSDGGGANARAPRLSDVGDYDDIAEYLSSGSLSSDTAASRRIEKRLRKYNEAVTRAQGLGSSVVTAEDLWQRVREKAQEAERKDELQNRSLMGHVGGFVGDVIASVDPRTDPLNFAMLGFGGIGKTAATRIGAQVFGQGAAEAVNQFARGITGVQRSRELLGLSHGIGQGLASVAGTALVAGAFQGVGEAAVHYLGRRYRPSSPDAEPPPSREAPQDTFELEDTIQQSPIVQKRINDDLDDIAEQLDQGIDPAHLVSSPTPLALDEVDPSTYKMYNRLEMQLLQETLDITSSQAEVIGRVAELDRKAITSGLVKNIDPSARKTFSEYLMREREELFERISDDPKAVEMVNINHEKMKLIPLLARMHARAHQRISPTTEDVKYVSKSVSRGWLPKSRTITDKTPIEPPEPPATRVPDEPITPTQEGVAKERQALDVAESKSAEWVDVERRQVKIPGIKGLVNFDEVIVTPSGERTVKNLVDDIAIDEEMLEAFTVCLN